MGLIPGSGSSPRGGTAIYTSVLAWESLDRGAWWAVVHRVTKSCAGVQPRWIQGIRSGNGVVEDQETTA